jgi:4-aminobutyrate aminotransferase-like enzyme
VSDCGQYFRQALEGLAKKHPMIGAVKGRGLFLGLDLVVDPETRQPASQDTLRQITTLLMQEGILTASTGRHGNVLKLRPPLPFDRSHADIAVAAIDRVISQQ